MPWQAGRANLSGSSAEAGDRPLALTDSLRRQNHSASLLALRLRDLVDHYQGGGDAYRVTLQLTRLHGLLRLHLVDGQNALHPAMLGSGDARLGSMAREMQEQGGCLAEGFERFMVRWSSSALIGSDFATFRAELGEVLDQIEARIHREDNELYPLVDTFAERGRRHAA